MRALRMLPQLGFLLEGFGAHGTDVPSSGRTLEILDLSCQKVRFRVAHPYPGCQVLIVSVNERKALMD